MTSGLCVSASLYGAEGARGNDEQIKEPSHLFILMAHSERASWCDERSEVLSEIIDSVAHKRGSRPETGVDCCALNHRHLADRWRGIRSKRLTTSTTAPYTR